VRGERLGVVGGGTMGAGIAELAAQAGIEVQVYDPDESVGGSTDISDLRGCTMVVEAAPERLELKRELFARLEAICGGDAVLATNTSSLSVTAIAAGADRPERIVGMHFFNPPARMKLVEVVAGDESSERALDATTAMAEAMGRTPIRARDSIGFVANRCARPFTLESLRMLGEGVETHEEIDRVLREAGGFRMGAFELMDLIGIDVNLAVARSFFGQSFGEPRWRPHPIQQRMVDSGRLGRKTGRGFYSYPSPKPDRTSVEPGEPVDPILVRLAAAIANEGCFALAEGVASSEDINTAMRLGFNWPLGPLEWGELLGWARALETLEALRVLHGEAYRPAPLLREKAAGG
jgi:3-hydroxybutyryl-CoA dehydrogenase